MSRSYMGGEKLRPLAMHTSGAFSRTCLHVHSRSFALYVFVAEDDLTVRFSVLVPRAKHQS